MNQDSRYINEKFLSFFNNDKKKLLEANKSQNEFCSKFGASPLTSIYPYFCKKALRPKLVELSKNLHRNLNNISNNYFENKTNSLSTISLPKNYSSLIKKNRTFNDNHPVIRVDCFIGENQDEIGIIEINSAEPSAFAWNDWMISGLLQNQSVNSFIKKYELGFDFLLPQYMTMVGKYFSNYQKDNGLTPTSNNKIRLYMPEDSTVYFDFKCLQFLLEQTAYDVTLDAPNNFINEKNAIHIRDSFEDLVNDSKTIYAKEMLSAIDNQSAFIMNPASSTFGDQKSLLPYLKNQLPIIDCYPFLKTSDPNFINHVMNNKDMYVLKPSQGYGGFGIHIGKIMSQSLWEGRSLVSFKKKRTILLKNT
jgi:glutathionylspermidine synthase